ncbi:ATP-binding cassette domain-containing protein [Kitasatospora sp. MBT63]|uniref:ATP-binding cassette domain-containing protein n=1 Tax=Kitasatospora sp. MBT63 TaxID=1444768 RepID=UPI00053B648B|nr:sugar ABC transporter ATP-binding protein [Kitasatospora sp. MBT63]
MAAAPGAPAPRLEVRGLSKTFASVRVLQDVHLDIAPGEIHGLAGHNGSGKSTLVKILAGVHAPDPGACIKLDGHPLRLPVRPGQAHAAGLGVVHQDLGLLDELSVADNICVGGFPVRRWTRSIDRAARDRLAEQALARLGVRADPCRRVASLPAAHQAAVATARAVRDHRPGSGLLVLDESTRAFTGPDREHIHAFLHRISEEGGSVLLVSHSLPELLRTADRISVLRDGRLVATGRPTAGLTEAELAHLMLGRRDVLATDPPERTVAPGTPGAAQVRVAALDGGRIHGVALTVGRGEIVGVGGVPGSGFEDIPRLLAGAIRARSGELTVGDRRLDLTRANVRACLRAGVVLVPERRDLEGLAYDIDVRDNICLPSLHGRGRPGFFSLKRQSDLSTQALQGLDIRPANPDRFTVGMLSGGNQQKVLLAKWFATTPELLILHEPSQGVDVGARSDILRALRKVADAGTSVLVVSGEPEILARLCDRVLVHRPDDGGLTQLDAPGDVEAALERLHSTGSTAQETT